MNRFLLVISIQAAFVGTAFTEDKSQTEPRELIARREEHQRSLQRATAPILSAYVRTLESLKLQCTREGKLEDALAVDNELKAAKQQYETATTAASQPAGASMQLAIVSAVFGDPATRRTIDVTKVVQQAFASGKPTLKLSGQELAPGKDPVRQFLKSTLITYTINGKRKQRAFTDNETVNFQADLQ